MQNEDEYGFAAYWRDVRAMAAECLAQPEDEREDWLHESVDGSSWVFSYYGARKCLEHSPNEDTGFDELGADIAQGINCLSMLHCRLAYFALAADVREALAEAEAEAAEAAEAEADAEGGQP